MAELSPYLRHHIRRYGEYAVDLTDIPPPLRDEVFDMALVDALHATHAAGVHTEQSA